MALALRHAGHDDEQFGDDAVGRPQLDAVEDVGTVLRRCRPRAQPRRVGADVRLGQQEGADRAAGAARQELASSALAVPASFSGSGTPIDWCADSSAPTLGCSRTDHHQRLVVVDLRQAQAAVLDRDLDAEAAELGEPFDVRVGDARLALDDRRRPTSRSKRRSASRNAATRWRRLRARAVGAGGSGRAGTGRGTAPCRTTACPSPPRGIPRRARGPASR